MAPTPPGSRGNEEAPGPGGADRHHHLRRGEGAVGGLRRQDEGPALHRVASSPASTPAQKPGAKRVGKRIHGFPGSPSHCHECGGFHVKSVVNTCTAFSVSENLRKHITQNLAQHKFVLCKIGLFPQLSSNLPCRTRICGGEGQEANGVKARPPKHRGTNHLDQWVSHKVGERQKIPS